MRINNYKLILFILIIIGLIIIYVFYNPFLNLNIIGDKTINITLNTDYDDEGATASYFGESLNNVAVESNVNAEKSGKYYVKYYI